MENTEKGHVDILMVEDNPGDIRLAKEAFRECNGLIHSHFAEDGEEAMAFLYRKGKYAASPRPDMIFLDLNLPKRNGREVLAEIKQSKELKSIPVAILTTSEAEEDIVDSYNLHANCYLTKPIDFEKFMDMVRNFHDFWFGPVELTVDNRR